MLVALVTAGLLFFAIGTALLGARDFSDARRSALADARFQAGVGARAIGDALQQSATVVSATLAEPSLAAAAAAPGECELAWAASGVFPDGRLDLLERDGTIACTSSQAARGERAAYFEDISAADGITVVGPFKDPFFGEPVLAVGGMLRDERGRPDISFVIVVELSPVAKELAKAFGGPSGFEFAVVDPAGASVVSASVAGPAPAQVPERGESGVFDGTTRLYGSSPVPGSTLRVHAGVAESVALAEAWSDVREETVVIVGALAIGLALAFVLYRAIGRPLRALTASIGQAERQVVPSPVSVDGPREIGDLAASFNAMIASTAAYEERLREAALNDPLTGLPNRALLLDRLEIAIAAAQRDHHQIAVLFVDLDRFKHVNESFGHEAGDDLLRAFADRLPDALRESDTVARFGGDAFVILGGGPTARADTDAIAKRIAALLEQPFVIPAGEITVGVSIGVSLGGAGATPEELLREADIAMSAAKRRGSRHEYFEDQEREVVNRLKMETELRRALDEGELSVHFQPIVDIGTGRVVGVEALARWRGPHGPVPPNAFIPVAEETGLIGPLGRVVLREATRQAAAWAASGRAVPVSVNISPRQLSDPGFPDFVTETLDAAGLDPSFLVLELTESALVEERGLVGDAVRALKALGVRLSVDDFGTGYSSLAYIQGLPIDEIKLDRLFVNGLGRRKETEAVILAVLELARALGISVVAEGVEDRNQLEALGRIGCAHAQGFLFARPAPGADVGPMIASGFDVTAPVARRPLAPVAL